MKTKRIKASLLRNNDRIVDCGKVCTVTDFKMVLREDIVTYNLADSDDVITGRWAGMDSIVDKVVDA